MANLIVAIIILAVLGAAIGYIVKEKRRGVKCVGCPSAGTCRHEAESFGGRCGCQSDTD